MKKIFLIAGVLFSFSSSASLDKVTYVAQNAKIVSVMMSESIDKVEFTTAYRSGIQQAFFCKSTSPFDLQTVRNTILQGSKSENSRVALRMVDHGDKVLCIVDANISIY